MLESGLYEQIINKELAELIDNTKSKEFGTVSIDNAEAAKVLSRYIADIIEKSLDNVADNGGDVNRQIELANKIVRTIISESGDDSFNDLSVDERAEQLFSVLDKMHTGTSKTSLPRPETSIARSSLFTGAVHEPQMFTELKKEILSADRVDMLVSFIKWSGLRLIIDELREFTQNGGELRIITTSYMGATDVKAIEELRALKNTLIKVSYDTKRTRLHAKTYVFYRNTGFTTAYVGSSNLSNAAISSGLEWNVKVTTKDLPETLQKINATFDSYWNSSEFEYYQEDQKERLARALRSEKYHESNAVSKYVFDITPYSYQQEILDRLKAEREIRNNYKNLVVAATGTGKTVISAFDYKNFVKAHKGESCRLLFVAHREEILKQSLETFRGVLKDANFGDLFVGGHRPEDVSHIFMSIQTFNSQEWDKQTADNYYDYIVVDEFHHAAAPSYQKLLSYYKPKILLGLTATPERMDGKNVTEYFDNRIAAEIRLPEAIDRKLLCPFQYFGVSDTVDLDGLKWTRGGYDRHELSNIYTMNQVVADKRADNIINSLFKYVTDLDEVKGLGFCVSIEHAEYMSRYFNEHNIPSMFLTGGSSDDDRNNAKKRLVNGEIRFIFVVDLYNEGVDIPEVNTILFLRPTESLTVFLQQLGRGLRLAENKECLTVLDFIGQANKKYNFEDKFAALLSRSTRSMKKEIESGFVMAPKGCYIQLEKKAKEIILQNIKQAISTKKGMISRIESFEEDTGLELSLKNFLTVYEIPVREIYSLKCTFKELANNGSEEKLYNDDKIWKVFYRLSLIDSRYFIEFLVNVFENIQSIDENFINNENQYFWNMLYKTIFEDTPNKESIFERIISYFKVNHNAVSEIVDLLKYKFERIDFIEKDVRLPYKTPLKVYSTYTRAQALAALDYWKTSSEGMTRVDDKKTTCLFITLNKSNNYYSPTTSYHDYSINDELFHWQSQNATSEDTSVGKRYINNKSLNENILLFVREAKEDKFGSLPFMFLGPADYVSHKGNKPMSIVWKLHNKIPAKYIKVTNTLGVI